MKSVLLAIAIAVAPLMSVAAGTTAKVEQGVLQGTKEDGLAVYRGVPFAAPPVGDLRWRAPQPAKPWQGVRKADQFSASCMQTIVEQSMPWTHEFMPHGVIGEDCLYANVWTPAKSAGAKLPVFVYVYGGAFTGGSGSVALYDGEGLARKGIVVVNFNYRVGIFGFFTHPELTKESEHHASGNYGLLDQVAALQWVRDNIAAFGGDPARVTIGGQSAGASSVHALTASPLAKGLFQRAIAQSGSSLGSMGLMGSRTLADSEQDGVRFATAKGAKSIADLRAMSAEQITAPVQAAGGGRGGPGFRVSVVVDGYMLPESVGQVFAEGKQNDVPTLTGLTANDMGITASPNITLEAFKSQAKQRYGDQAAAFLKAYPATSNAEAAKASLEASRDQNKVSMYLWATARAKSAKTKAFTYYWNHTMPGPRAAQDQAFHSSELAYMFNTLYMSERPFVDADHKIAETLSSYWVNFVTTGDPNGKGLAHWPAVGEKPDITMEVGDDWQPVPLAADPARIEFWKTYLARQSAAAPTGRGGN